MTPAPLTAEALVEARELVRQSLRVGAPGLSETAREAVTRSIMLKLEGKVLAPLLAAEDSLQRVTAERDDKADVLAEMKLCAEASAVEREGLLAEAARLRGDVEAKDKDRAVTALMVIALCNSVLGNSYLGKEGEEALAGHVKAAFIDPALARAATEKGQADANLR